MATESSIYNLSDYALPSSGLGYEEELAAGKLKAQQIRDMGKTLLAADQEKNQLAATEIYGTALGSMYEGDRSAIEQMRLYIEDQQKSGGYSSDPAAFSRSVAQLNAMTKNFSAFYTQSYGTGGADGTGSTYSDILYNQKSGSDPYADADMQAVGDVFEGAQGTLNFLNSGGYSPDSIYIDDQGIMMARSIDMQGNVGEYVPITDLPHRQLGAQAFMPELEERSMSLLNLATENRDGIIVSQQRTNSNTGLTYTFDEANEEWFNNEIVSNPRFLRDILSPYGIDGEASDAFFNGKATPNSETHIKSLLFGVRDDNGGIPVGESGGILEEWVQTANFGLTAPPEPGDTGNKGKRSDGKDLILGGPQEIDLAAQGSTSVDVERDEYGIIDGTGDKDVWVGYGEVLRNAEGIIVTQNSLGEWIYETENGMAISQTPGEYTKTGEAAPGAADYKPGDTFTTVSYNIPAIEMNHGQYGDYKIISVAAGARGHRMVQIQAPRFIVADMVEGSMLSTSYREATAQEVANGMGMQGQELEEVAGAREWIDLDDEGTDYVNAEGVPVWMKDGVWYQRALDWEGTIKSDTPGQVVQVDGRTTDIRSALGEYGQIYNQLILLSEDKLEEQNRANDLEMQAEYKKAWDILQEFDAANPTPTPKVVPVTPVDATPIDDKTVPDEIVFDEGDPDPVFEPSPEPLTEIEATVGAKAIQKSWNSSHGAKMRDYARRKIKELYPDLTTQEVIDLANNPAFQEALSEAGYIVDATGPGWLQGAAEVIGQGAYPRKREIIREVINAFDFEGESGKSLIGAAESPEELRERLLLEETKNTESPVVEEVNPQVHVNEITERGSTTDFGDKDASAYYWAGIDLGETNGEKDLLESVLQFGLPPEESIQYKTLKYKFPEEFAAATERAETIKVAKKAAETENEVISKEVRTKLIEDGLENTSLVMSNILDLTRPVDPDADPDANPVEIAVNALPIGVNEREFVPLLRTMVTNLLGDWIHDVAAEGHEFEGSSYWSRGVGAEFGGDAGKFEGVRASSDPLLSWCAAWVATMLNLHGGAQALHDDVGQTGRGAPGVYKLMRAKSYSHIGVAVPEKEEYREGDVVVVDSSKAGNHPGTHVAFFAGWTADGKMLLLGGNQGDKISIKINKARVVSVRRVEAFKLSVTEIENISALILAYGHKIDDADESTH